VEIDRKYTRHLPVTYRKWGGKLTTDYDYDYTDYMITMIRADFLEYALVMHQIYTGYTLKMGGTTNYFDYADFHDYDYCARGWCRAWECASRLSGCVGCVAVETAPQYVVSPTDSRALSADVADARTDKRGASIHEHGGFEESVIWLWVKRLTPGVGGMDAE
jgi:hypothetical protein